MYSLRVPSLIITLSRFAWLELLRVCECERVKRPGSFNTVTRFENGFGAMVETLGRIQNALEAAGVVFIPADHGGGPGVRLREIPTNQPRRKRSR